jgi:hypothetical protein
MSPLHSSSRAVLAALMAVGLAGCTISIPLRGDLAALAERDLGKGPRQMGVPASLWCADAANKWRAEAGLTPVRSRRAIDQAKAGRRIARPVRGALMITRRGLRGHHVDVVLEVLPGGMVRVAGGNVDGLVRERILPAQGLFVLPG